MRGPLDVAAVPATDGVYFLDRLAHVIKPRLSVPTFRKNPYGVHLGVTLSS
jgi:hypothetical protein